MSLESATRFGYLYDALSGEFVPPTDPENTHSLARLMLGTINKGDEKQFRPWDGSPKFNEYSPSWAPVNVRVFHLEESVLALSVGHNPLGIKLQYVITPTDDNPSLYEFLATYYSAPNSWDQCLTHLGLGQDFDPIKEFVKLQAQEFFNQIKA